MPFPTGRKRWRLCLGWDTDRPNSDTTAHLSNQRIPILHMWRSQRCTTVTVDISSTGRQLSGEARRGQYQSWGASGRKIVACSLTYNVCQYVLAYTCNSTLEYVLHTGWFRSDLRWRELFDTGWNPGFCGKKPVILQQPPPVPTAPQREVYQLLPCHWGE